MENNFYVSKPFSKTFQKRKITFIKCFRHCLGTVLKMFPKRYQKTFNNVFMECLYNIKMENNFYVSKPFSKTFQKRKITFIKCFRHCLVTVLKMFPKRYQKTFNNVFMECLYNVKMENNFYVSKPFSKTFQKRKITFIKCFRHCLVTVLKMFPKRYQKTFNNVSIERLCNIKMENNFYVSKPFSETFQKR